MIKSLVSAKVINCLIAGRQVLKLTLQTSEGLILDVPSCNQFNLAFSSCVSTKNTFFDFLVDNKD